VSGPGQPESPGPLTRRQEIARLLKTGSFGAADIARRLGAPLRLVFDDLEHVRRGLKEGERWVATTAECLACGFVFRGRERLTTPSRCPRCRSEDIRDPEFGIEEA
jgi:predicted Zn-ribbon and HTH transcriptional regulator